MFKFGRKKKDSIRELEPEPEFVPEVVSDPLSGADLETVEQKEKISKRAKLGGYL